MELLKAAAHYNMGQPPHLIAKLADTPVVKKGMQQTKVCPITIYVYSDEVN